MSAGDDDRDRNDAPAVISTAYRTLEGCAVVAVEPECPACSESAAPREAASTSGKSAPTSDGAPFAPRQRDPSLAAGASAIALASGAGAASPAMITPSSGAQDRELAALSRRAFEAWRRADDRAARRAVDQALALAPDHPETSLLLGVARRRAGETEAALRALERSFAARPDSAACCEAIGDARADRGDKPGALEAYRRAVALRPGGLSALARAASAALELGLFDEAERFARSSLEFDPFERGALRRLAAALASRGAFEEAEQALERAGLARTELAEAWCDFGRETLRFEGDLRGEAIFRRALEWDPEHVGALTGLGAAAMRAGDARGAKAALERAIERVGPACEAAALLGNFLVLEGETERGIELLAGALERPDATAAEHSRYLSSLLYSSAYPPEWIHRRHRGYQRRWAAKIRPMAAGAPRRPDPERPLTIGFVSSDFRAHAVSYFFLPLARALSRAGVRLIGYSSVRRPDVVTEEIRGHFAEWRPIAKLEDEAAARRVWADEVDALVDLGGHTLGARPLIFAHKPAPVQLTYLGYAATTGLDAIDARLVDWTSDPEGYEAHASERLIRLERCFLCFRPQHYPEIAPPPCLAKGRPTFGSFNKFAKITDEVMDLWAEVLRAAPGSTLVLKDHTTRDDVNRARLSAGFEARGVSPDRLRFLDKAATLIEHLERYAEIDVALDTFPYGGTTTTCEALWMGVPVVTLLGDRHAARVSGSVLRAVGLDAAVASDRADYVATARELAGSPEMLRALRTILRGELVRSDLFDEDGVASAVLDAIRGLWRERCADARARRNAPVP